MTGAEEYLKKIGIDNRIINREDLQEYWKRPSDLMEEYHREQVKNSVVLADVSKQRELLIDFFWKYLNDSTKYNENVEPSDIVDAYLKDNL